MKFGIEAFSWQIAGRDYMGRLDHVVDVASQCGILGVEAEICMLGSYADDYPKLKELLDSKGMSLAAICYVENWRGHGETVEESARADWVIDYLTRFSNALLQLCPRLGSDRSDLRERQRNATRCMNDVARRASDRGLMCTVHPSSPPGSVFRTADDYEALFDGLESHIGWTPDTGNIYRGGMDPLETIHTYGPLVRLVHLKDISVSGQGAILGNGVIGLKAIVSYLADSGFDGWAIIDDESPLAYSDPDEAARRDAKYACQRLICR